MIDISNVISERSEAKIGGHRLIGQKKKSLLGRPLVTIVTVVYNGVNHVEQAIKSVLSQTYDNIEYIVIDGGSTDGTLSTIRKYEDQIDLWVSEPDGGIYDAMNKGIRLANGQLIGLLNSDDSYLPGAIEQVVQAFLLAGTDKAIVYGDYLLYKNIMLGHAIRHIFSNAVSLSQVTTRLREELLEYRSIRVSGNLVYWKGMPFCHQSMFVSKNIYSELSYNSRLKLAADYDFVLRAIKQDIKFIGVEQPLVRYWAGGMTSKNILKSCKESVLSYAKHFGVYNTKFWVLVFSLAGREAKDAITRTICYWIVDATRNRASQNPGDKRKKVLCNRRKK